MFRCIPDISIWYWRNGMAGKTKDETSEQGKSKKGMSRKARTWLIVGIIVIAAVAAVVIYQVQAKANAASTYQTTAVARGTLTATIGATGNVHANQTANINWQTSGTVASVNMNVGDQAKAGDVLATLAPTSLAQNVTLAQADLITAQRNLESILKSSTQRAQAQVTLVNAQKTVDNANYTLNSLLSSDQDRTSVDIDNARSELDHAQQAYNDARTKLDSLQSLPETDAGKIQATTALSDARQTLTRAQDTLVALLQVPRGGSIDLAHAKLVLAQAQLDDAQREWDRLKNGPDPSDVAAAQARVDATQATLNSSRLTAPFAGTVTVVNPKVGDQVTPATPGFRVDDLSHMLVDVQVSEVDINSVRVGQPAVVTFDAVLGREYQGQVVAVSQVGTSVQSVVYFSVTVELTSPDADVKPGMTASVTITIQSLENVLLVPNRAVHLVNGQRVVYVLRNGQLVEIPVTLGASDNTMSEVTSGDLSVGDVLVLNPPANFTPGQGGRGMFGGG
jgi:HlyD family secretion protein